jgi:hypothetical protein
MLWGRKLNKNFMQHRHFLSDDSGVGMQILCRILFKHASLALKLQVKE